MLTECSMNVHWLFTECSCALTTLQALGKHLLGDGVVGTFGLLEGVHSMLIERSLNVQWMLTECSYANYSVGPAGPAQASSWRWGGRCLWPLGRCSLNINWMFTKRSMNVDWMLTECSYANYSVGPASPAQASSWRWGGRCLWPLGRCSLNVNWMFTKRSQNVDWMFIR
jgi:hypothetical protein